MDKTAQATLSRHHLEHPSHVHRYIMDFRASARRTMMIGVATT